MYVALLLLATMAGAAIGTGWLRGYALQRALVDVPNERSSHISPTPRGGGASVVVAASSALAFGGALDWICPEVVVGLLVGGLAVGAVGFVDDRGHVPVHWRLLVHFAAGIWIVMWWSPVAAIPVLGSEVDLGYAGWLLAILWVAWMLNLYNFMDGIDGIAGLEAVTVAAGAGGLLWAAGDNELALSTAIFGMASAGFLAWNWPPAKIFLGDVGSGFLGFAFGALALISNARGAVVLWAWLILLGVFVVDATVTLLRRLIRREKVYEAHRSHGYQRAALRWHGHKTVVIAVGLINIFWLLPLAMAAALWPDSGIVLLGIAWAPLIAIAVYLGAGT